MRTSVEAAKLGRCIGGRDPGGRLVAYNWCKLESADKSGIGPEKLLSWRSLSLAIQNVTINLIGSQLEKIAAQVVKLDGMVLGDTSH